VQEHDILAEMETDKALVEVPSPRTGVIAALHGSEGEILKVGNVLVTYEAGAGAGAGGGSGGGSAAHATKPASSNGTHAASAHDDEEPPARTEDDGTVVGKMTGSMGGVSAEAGKVLATPAVRRLARDLGVDLSRVAGTGIAGRITEKDVRGAVGGGSAARSATGGRAAAPAPSHRALPDVAPMDRSEPHSRVVEAPMPTRSAAAHPSPAPAPRRETPSIPAGEATLRVPFRGVRRTIANRLRESVNQAVHFNVMDEADISALDGLRKKLSAATGEKISVLPFVASAVCRVLTGKSKGSGGGGGDAFRAMNATVDEKPGDANYEASIVQHRAVHLGIAADTDSGLMVPVIRDCDALGVIEIARHIAHVADAARSRSASREMLSGSTFTISNVGSHAGRFATPIINYPEAAILGVGRARPAPVIRNGGIFVGNLLPLSLACDHRVVDGATAALALAEIIALLQDPEQLLAPARG
jgi:pyruvate dehydrogenase E2 component (dihydrolipoamide acetyltransferase)